LLSIPIQIASAHPSGGGHGMGWVGRDGRTRYGRYGRARDGRSTFDEFTFL
jgi:hypothetical protein